MTTFRTALLVALAAAPGLARGGERLVLVPFDGQVGSEVRGRLAAQAALTLAFAGYEVIGGEAVERFLEAHRIRYLDSLAQPAVEELAREMKADGVVLGAILGLGGERVASAALAVRLLAANGRLVWTASAGRSLPPPSARKAAAPAPALPRAAEPAPADLLGALVAEVLSAIPRSVQVGAVRTYAVEPGEGPRTYVARGLVSGPRRICLLPFTNHAPAQGAPRVVEATLLHALAERGEFRVVEPADLRAAFVAEGIYSPQLLSLAALRRLSARVGGCLFLRGDVFSFDEVTGASGPTPRVEIYGTMIEPDRGRTVWSALHGRRGEEFETVLELGALHSRFEVGSRVIAELVQELCRKARGNSP